jgi:hypothetical protein
MEEREHPVCVFERHPDAEILFVRAHDICQLMAGIVESHIVAANQFLDQYPTSMRAAILSVANFVCFQLSSVDAATLAQMLDGGKALAEHIKNLPPRHFILKSGSEHWIEGRVPEIVEPKTSYAGLLSRSRAIYARPRAEIEREIASRHSSMTGKSEDDLHDWD